MQQEVTRRRIATRLGRPAYENAPPPRRAAVPMREWTKHHKTEERRS